MHRAFVYSDSFVCSVCLCSLLLSVCVGVCVARGCCRCNVFVGACVCWKMCVEV